MAETSIERSSEAAAPRRRRAGRAGILAVLVAKVFASIVAVIVFSRRSAEESPAGCGRSNAEPFGRGPTRQCPRLVRIPLRTVALGVIAAVVFAMVLAGCRGSTGGQASTVSSAPAAPSTSKPDPNGAGPYTVAATISVEGGAFGLAVDPGTHTIYVANAANTVSVIDGATRSVTATVTVGRTPVDLGVDSSTHTLYVAGSDNTVSVIDEATRTVTATVALGKSPVDLAVDSSTHTAYVTTGRACGNAGFCYGDGTVSVIDGATRTVVGTVALEGDTTDVAVDPGTHAVYVSTFGGVSVIDGATRTVTATVPLHVDSGSMHSYPYDLAVDPGTHTVYVTYGYNDTLSVVDGATRTVTATMQLPTGKETLHMLAVDPNTHTVYVSSPVYGANQGNATVSVIERRS